MYKLNTSCPQDNLKQAFANMGISINSLVKKSGFGKPRERQRYIKYRDLYNKAKNHTKRAQDKLTVATVQRVYEDNIKKYGVLTCYLCRQPIVFGGDSLEHIVPISKGGTNEYNNLRVAHSACNNTKKAKLLGELGKLPALEQKHTDGIKHIKHEVSARKQIRKGYENF